jgi:cytidine deaminase
MKNSELVGSAITALKHTYSPYSKYPVGAALLTKEGSVYAGCNMENASYGLTICAERSAFGSAISEGEREFQAIAIVTESGNMPYPCGACLQVMSEFCGKDFLIITAVAENKNASEENTLGNMLKAPFAMRND